MGGLDRNQPDACLSLIADSNTTRFFTIPGAVDWSRAERLFVPAVKTKATLFSLPIRPENADLVAEILEPITGEYR